jgi:RNA polymerase sigma factor (sigma-70 family)
MIECATQPCSPLSDPAFKEKMAAVIPQLRAYARSLCGSRDTADDLVQETMLKAWSARARFLAGTNFRAWTFTILRNLYFSQLRRSKFVGDWDDLTASRLLAAPASQERALELHDLMRAMAAIPTGQREALILVGAGGIAYEEAAEIMGVAVGTVKSRVARARAALEAILEEGQLDTPRRDFMSNDEAVSDSLKYLDDAHARLGVRSSPIVSLATTA